MIPQIISFKCIVRNRIGSIISTTYNKDVITSIHQDQKVKLRGLAKGLQNLTKGEQRTVHLCAEEAYGFYDPYKVVYYPRSKLPKDIVVNQTLTIVGKLGRANQYKVIALGDMVALDANHPLAGQDLVFEIEALEVRDATPSEVDAASNDLSVQRLH